MWFLTIKKTLFFVKKKKGANKVQEAFKYGINKLKGNVKIEELGERESFSLNKQYNTNIENNKICGKL